MLVQALIRDNYRCVFTGHIDDTAYETFAFLRSDGDNEDNHVLVNPTRCSHILPEATNLYTTSGVDADGGGCEVKSLILGVQHQYAASVWTIMSRIGGVDVSELNGELIHRLENVMTMESAIHNLFDDLKIWFEATASFQLSSVTNIIITL